MDYNITYDIDYSSLNEFVDQLEKRLGEGSNLKGAIRAAGTYFANEWIKTAAGKFKHSQGGYALGIVEGSHYPFSGDPLHFRIEHTQKYALYLERGFDPFDLKKMLQTSLKVRVDKDGKRFLVIPFRYGTPGSKFRSMPDEVYKKARDLEQSQIIGKYREGVQQGAKSFEQAQLQKKFNSVKVQRNAYKYGEQLSGLPEKYKQYEGIFRFENNPNLNRSEISTGKFVNSTDSEQQYSTYIKFAVMREDDSGWQHPGLKPMNILGETVERERVNVLNLIRSGLLKDMESLGFQTC